MSSEKDISFVQQLVEATTMGKVSWQPTASIDEFTTSFKGRFSLIVRRIGEGHHVFRMLDEREREMLKLEYVDPSDQLEIDIPPEAVVAELYEVARRQALQVDDAIDGILQELGKK